MNADVRHEAGPMINRIQRCRRCGVTLKDGRAPREIPLGECRQGMYGGVVYPEGAVVVRSRYFQAMSLSNEEPDCQPARWAGDAR